MSLNLVGLSTLGTPCLSTLGALTVPNQDTPLNVVWTSVFNYQRFDKPFGVIQSQVSTSGVGPFGKDYTGVDARRLRVGISFLIPGTFTGTGPCTLSISTTGFNNTLETWFPQAFSSDTDDHLGAGSWYNNLNHNLGNGVYFTSPQVFTVPGSLVLARAGSYFSIVLGSNTELSNGGVTTINGKVANANLGSVLVATLTR